MSTRLPALFLLLVLVACGPAGDPADSLVAEAGSEVVRLKLDKNP